MTKGRQISVLSLQDSFILCKMHQTTLNFNQVPWKQSSKIHQTNERQFQTSLNDTLEEDLNVLESLELLLQEAEGWERGVNEVIILKKIQNPQEILSLDGYLQKKKVGGGESLSHCSWKRLNGQWELESRCNQWSRKRRPPRRCIKGIPKELIDVAELNIYFKTFKEERNQMYTKLAEEDEISNALKDHMKNLQTEKDSLQGKKKKQTQKSISNWKFQLSQKFIKNKK